jgi:Tfp pilus assembly protein PilZ
MSSPIRIAFVAHPSEDRDLFLSRLVRHGNVEPDSFFSVDEFKRAGRGRLYSGVVVDLKTVALLDENDKPFFEELARSFPVLRVRRIGEPDQISGTVEGRPLAGQALLEAFVDGLCRKAKPRCVRTEERRSLVLSVLVRAAPGGEPLRANVANVSHGGFFVVTPHELRCERLYLEVQDLDDRTPIVCAVRWRMPWGTSQRSLPGYGVAFESITTSQAEQLERLAREAPINVI